MTVNAIAAFFAVAATSLGIITKASKAPLQGVSSNMATSQADSSSEQFRAAGQLLAKV